MRGEVKAGVATIVVEGDVQEDARLSARVVGPQLNVMEVPLAATALGRFEAGFPANDQGPYLLQIVEEGAQGKRRSSAAGLVAPYSPEYKDLEARPRLLERLAAITNGRVLDNPQESFGPGLPPAYGDVPLGWWLLMAAALLLPLDVALRRLNLPLTDVVAWLAAAKAWALRGRVTSLPDAAPPVLESLRQRRAARPRLEVGNPGERESGAALASISRRQGAKTEEQPARSRDTTSIPHRQEGDGVESATERWLQAKRRARNR
jgi:hypothetical protein